MKQVITLKQIAEEAGVSVMTVSNVIHNNQGKVSPATVEKVRAIIDKYHYVPNMAARSLIAKASKIIALLLPQWHDTADNLLANPYVGQLVGALEMLLRQRGYYGMLCSFTTAEEGLILQRNWRVDGSVLVLPHEDPITRILIEHSDAPLVVIDRFYEDMKMRSVQIDDEKGGYLAARHLLKQGHKRIGFACPDLYDSSVIQDRYAGFCRALAEFGIQPEEKWLFHGFYHEEGGKAIGAQLAEMEDCPTGVVATEDLIACGIIQGLQACGMSVPDDFSVIGFDDSLPARLISPALTSVRQSVTSKAQAAVELLMEGIEGNGTADARVMIDVDIVERNSVARIN